MSLTDLKKSLKNSGQLISRAGNDPYFDWAVILILSLLAAAIFLGFSVNLFLRTSAEAESDSTIAVSSTVPVESALDTADLVNLIAIFESKKAQATVFATTYPGPSDPAIPVRATKVAVSQASTASSSPRAKTPAKTPAKTVSK